MICEKCGAQIPEDAVFCNFCGNKIGEEPPEDAGKKAAPQTDEEPAAPPVKGEKLREIGSAVLAVLSSWRALLLLKKKEWGKRAIVFAVLVLLAAGVGTGAYMGWTSPKARFGRALAKEDFEEAYAVFSEEMEPDALKEKQVESLTAAVQKAEEEYSSGTISYDEAVGRLGTLEQFKVAAVSDAIKTALGEMAQMEEIAGYLEAAEEYVQLEAYELALEENNAVLEIDPDNETALQGVSSAVEKIVDGFVARAEEKVAEDNFSRGAFYYKKALEYDPDAEAAVNGLAEIAQKEAETWLKKAEAYSSDGNYPDALKMYGKALKADPGNAQAEEGKTKTETSYAEAVAAEAQKLADEGKFDEARDAAADGVAHGLSKNSAELTAVLDYIHEKQVESMRADIDYVVGTGDWDRVFQILDEYEADLPGDEALAEIRQEVHGEQIEFIRAAVDEVVGAGDWDRAFQILDEYEAEMPGDEALAEIRQDVEEKRPVSLKNLAAKEEFHRYTDDGTVKDRLGNTYDGCVKIDGSYDGYALYALDKKYTEFRATVFVPTEASGGKNQELTVYLDDEVVFHQEGITENTAPISLVIDTSGADSMKISVKNHGSYSNGWLYFTDSNFKKAE